MILKQELSPENASSFANASMLKRRLGNSKVMSHPRKRDEEVHHRSHWTIAWPLNLNSKPTTKCKSSIPLNFPRHCQSVVHCGGDFLEGHSERIGFSSTTKHNVADDDKETSTDLPLFDEVIPHDYKLVNLSPDEVDPNWIGHAIMFNFQGSGWELGKIKQVRPNGTKWNVHVDYGDSFWKHKLVMEDYGTNSYRDSWALVEPK